MKSYKFTLSYPEKKSPALENKIGPLVRKHNGKFESKFNFADNETIVTVTLPRADKAGFEADLKDPKYNFLNLESVVFAMDEE